MNWKRYDEYPEFKSEKEMFLWIWEREEHVSRISGLPLFYPHHPQFHWQFAHILGAKGSVYAKWRLNPNNICLMLPEEHTVFDHRGVEGNELYKNILEIREEMKLYYHNCVN